jgi:hypothetical protein
VLTRRRRAVTKPTRRTRRRRPVRSTCPPKRALLTLAGVQCGFVLRTPYRKFHHFASLVVGTPPAFGGWALPNNAGKDTCGQVAKRTCLAHK